MIPAPAAESMSQKPDPDKLKGPGGMSMRQLHELVQQSAARDQAAGKVSNKLVQRSNRWQRFVRYVWDRKKG